MVLDKCGILLGGAEVHVVYKCPKVCFNVFPWLLAELMGSSFYLPLTSSTPSIQYSEAREYLIVQTKVMQRLSLTLAQLHL